MYNPNIPCKYNFSAVIYSDSIKLFLKNEMEKIVWKNRY